jgi:hypothetical protein
MTNAPALQNNVDQVVTNDAQCRSACKKINTNNTNAKMS